MRLYSDSSEEAFRARKLLKQWKNDGDLSEQQYRQLEQDTLCDLRTTNIFLRLVLLFFTTIAVAAAVGLFFVLFSIRSSESTAGVWFLIFAVLSYIAAEAAASQAHLYRYGIEEALAICSVAFVCISLGCFLFPGATHSSHVVMSLISAVGAGASLWIWRRFGLWYVFPAAMIAVIFLPVSWTDSRTAQRCFICVLYTAGLACIAAIRPRHRLLHLEADDSLAEAFLWLGIYLVLNLKLTALNAPSELWGNSRIVSEFTPAFYWTTYALLWLLPPAILARGVRLKDRFLIAAGMLTAVLTLVTNKPYLGLQRHTWDPMLLGIALIAVAVFLFRWLARGPGGVHHGFTANRVGGKYKHSLSVAQSLLGLLTPHAITPAPQPAQPQGPSFESGFGGGSGGGGASGDF